MPTSRDRPEPGVGSGLWTCSSTAGRFTWELGAALPQPVQTSAVVTCISGLAVLGIELTIQMKVRVMFEHYIYRYQHDINYQNLFYHNVLFTIWFLDSSWFSMPVPVALVISAPASRLMSFDSSSMDLGLRLANSLCEVGCVEIDVEILMFERNSINSRSKTAKLVTRLGLHKSDFLSGPGYQRVKVVEHQKLWNQWCRHLRICECLER